MKFCKVKEISVALLYNTFYISMCMKILVSHVQKSKKFVFEEKERI